MEGSVVYEVSDGPNFLQTIFQTVASVHFTDLPIIAYIAFLGIWYYLYFFLRNSVLFHTLMFFVSITLVFLTENANAFFSQNWKKFGFSQNYFDTECIFALAFWTIPFSIIAILITFSFFVDLCKSIATHRFFRSFIPEAARTEEKLKAD